MKRRSISYPESRPSIVVDWTPSCADRRTLPRTLAEKWSEEEPYTNYRYKVERCASGSCVCLLRPMWLNKGCDVQVNVEASSRR